MIYVTGDTMVLMADESEIRIDWIRCGDMVYTDHGPMPVQDVMRGREHEIVKIVFTDGRALQFAPNQNLLTDRGYLPITELRSTEREGIGSADRIMLGSEGYEIKSITLEPFDNLVYGIILDWERKEEVVFVPVLSEEDEQQCAGLKLSAIHHIAIIVSDYNLSKDFYVNKLGFSIIRENYRPERNDWKLDLQCGNIELEIFGVSNPPARVSHPEACGLRHLAFRVDSVEDMVKELEKLDIECEPIRTDTFTGKKMTFFQDPDGLPLELHE